MCCRDRRRSDADCSAHRLDQALTDREAKPGPAILTARRRADLREILKKQMLLFPRDADPAIHDFKVEPIAAWRNVAPKCNFDAAARCELERVDEQIEQDLPQARRISKNPASIFEKSRTSLMMAMSDFPASCIAHETKAQFRLDIPAIRVAHTVRTRYPVAAFANRYPSSLECISVALVDVRSQAASRYLVRIVADEGLRAGRNIGNGSVEAELYERISRRLTNDQLARTSSILLRLKPSNV